MADKKISELTALTGANVATDDQLVIVDTSAALTKNITIDEFKNALDTATGFVRITGDTMTGALDVQSTITSDGLTVDTGSGVFEVLAAGGSSLNLKNTNSGYVQLESADRVQIVTNSNERLKVASNGDISFYEDTGTTAKFFWDASAESLGIGTTTGTESLSIKDTAGFQISFGNTSASSVGAIGYDNNDKLKIYGSGETRMTIDSSGNVGIGTSSPTLTAGATGIDIYDNSDAQIRLHNSTTGTTTSDGLLVSLASDNSGYFYNYENAPLIFGTNNTERMRIDSSGNVAINSNGAVDGLDGVFGLQVGNSSSAASGISIATANRGYLWYIPSGSTSLSLWDSTANSDRMTIDSSGNLLVGTTTKLSPTGTSKEVGVESSVSAEVVLNCTKTGGINWSIGSGSGGSAGTGFLSFYDDTSSTEAMRIDSSGNLLVGKSVLNIGTVGTQIGPTGQAYITADSDIPLDLNRKTLDGDIVSFRKDGSTVGSISTLNGMLAIGNDNVFLNIDGGSGDYIYPMSSASGGASDGAVTLGFSSRRFKNLYLSAIGYFGHAGIIGAGNVGVNIREIGQIRIGRSGTANATQVSFSNGNGEVGKIVTSGSATSYNTSSDYRLKTDAQPMTGATDRLKQLNPVNFEWIADGTRVDGFLAHEAQAVVPEAVTGAKDAMRDEEYEVTPAVLDDDGNVVTKAVMGTRSVPDYQGIDQSKLVPLLVATIKELEVRITALENA